MQSRNKRSVALDLKDPDAQDIVRELAREADVLIENFRPGALEGWGLAPETLLSSTRGSSSCASAAMARPGPTATAPASAWSRKRWAGCAT